MVNMRMFGAAAMVASAFNYIATAIAVALLLWLAASFNGLVRRRNMVREAWSGIDVQLKLRSTLIPNIVELVKGYARHERTLLEGIASLRKQGLQEMGVRQMGEVSSEMSKSINLLLAVSENYPELKANESFAKLQSQLVEVEDDLQMARRYYNGAARDMNIAAESFPTILVAKLFGFKPAEFFALDDVSEMAAPEVRL
ncbi:MAG: LemA family protein [Kiritimatiellia bacterium]|uniref:LemA family protein n=1 Tax=Atribacter sp. TaxID=2847780 RepID=UPI003D980383